MSMQYPDYAFEIVNKACEDIIFDGWTMPVLKKTAHEIDLSPHHVKEAFPKGVSDAICCYARLMDQKMLSQLEKEAVDKDDLSIRGRIARALEQRFKAIEPFKEVERQAVGVMMHPKYVAKGSRSAWKTADAIWTWAGDTSDDYNHYTKRLLLSSVVVKSTLFYLQDESADFVDTKEFVRRQLDQIVERGKMISKAKPVMNGLWRFAQRFRMHQ